MKNFFSNIGWWILILIGVILLLVSFASVFIGLRNVAVDIGGGSIVVGILLIPFVIIGGIDIFRGFCAVIEKDEWMFTLKKDHWKGVVYILLRILGYVALFFAVKNLLK